MTDRELMQQALEALDVIAALSEPYDVLRIQTALRERLAQPEQESVKFNCTVVDDAHPEGVPLSQWGKQQKYKPVAWADMAVRGEDKGLSWTPGHFHKTPLYTEPPKKEWQGLTEVAIRGMCERVPDYDISTHDLIQFARAIEAKLKERNHG